jgi:hypothetical protein
MILALPVRSAPSQASEVRVAGSVACPHRPLRRAHNFLAATTAMKRAMVEAVTLSPASLLAPQRTTLKTSRLLRDKSKRRSNEKP